MTTSAYLQGQLELQDGTASWISADFYAILVGSGYEFSDAHTTYANVSTHEIEDADYTRQALASKSITLSSGAILYDCANINFGAEVSINAAGGSLIILRGTAASPASGDRLHYHWPLAAPGQSTNSQFAVNTPNGVYRIPLNVPED